MVEKRDWQIDKSRLLSEEALSTLLSNIAYLYKQKQTTHHLGDTYTIDRETDKKLESLYLLQKEHERLQEETSGYEEMLGGADNDEYQLLMEDFRKTKLGKEALRTKVIKIISDETGTGDNCLIEIRPGVGGVEAGLFARDLFQMYYKFIENKKWKLEVLENRADSLGNLSFISFLIKGREAFRYLKNEAGVHRVQRVPRTESKGRIQTSTTSVVVLPEIDEVIVKLKNSELRIDSYRSSGAGGQHVNTTDSAVRVTHLPTGISTTSQDGRSQHDNKEKALLILRSRLFEKYRSEQAEKLGSIRSSAIGSSERAEKIRTYNYSQNRISDHRIGLTINRLNAVIEGKLEELCQQLIVFELENKIVNFSRMVSNKINEKVPPRKKS